ncbi:MAG: 30S ribosomal protein S17 [Patescibacteria group bacterium]|nr:30S ribosomal protein S17 [Patescibacteria group bacterium]
MSRESSEKKTKASGRKKGIVVSDAMDKTAVVEVTMIKTLKKYHKKYRDMKHYSVHDETNSAKVGDLVHFEECKPLSKTKKWRIIEKR